MALHDGTDTGWPQFRLRKRTALVGALICALVGVLALRLAGELVLLSYDLPILMKRTAAPSEVVIVYMDDESFARLSQDSSVGWDRNLHAQLVDRMTKDQAKLIVFDVVFDQPRDPPATTNLIRAFRESGRVVLAGAIQQQTRGQVAATKATLPLPEIMDAAVGCGVAAVHSDGDGITRQYFRGSKMFPNLPSAALAALEGNAPWQRNMATEKIWLNYYGPALTLPSVSYADVTSLPPGYFRDKVVFVGARPDLLKTFDQADVVQTPHSRWSGGHPKYFPGVEVTATAFLNLWRGESFREMPVAWEAGLIVIAGLIAGGILGFLRPLPAAALSALAVLACLWIALRAAEKHVWFPWTVIAFVEVPVGLLWSVRTHFYRLTFEKSVAEKTLEETKRFATTLRSAPSGDGVKIPDHELLKCVGKGAYGEVWLARNAIGAFHAVKIIKRSAFASDAPYEREFRGIQKFMPISRSHPGFVHVLHVGRAETGTYFFYIMEACDDATTGQGIDPASYSPKTLATELTWRGKLPPQECLHLGLSLSAALEHLHQQHLIHRDIKPGNIIYVNGAPKLADIGLVTEMGGEVAQVSCLGTEGYVPPEGPGTGGADVYGLGKVLYEASMGRDRLLFPEVPTAVLEAPDDALLKKLNNVIGRACATDPAERYRSAAELHEALKALS